MFRLKIVLIGVLALIIFLLPREASLEKLFWVFILLFVFFSIGSRPKSKNKDEHRGGDNGGYVGSDYSGGGSYDSGGGGDCGGGDGGCSD